ncbi:molybdopterin biosynthesis protein MoeB [Glaciihabitans sp. INWT7]|uniref:ThiF family adenylyltransferase n=1 Tax=Glaciihabitans sp. INWT7 TaxID=2596912 RepID=UPI001625C7F0|nr:ThiF family adenylyltransferase [Glaciihabitans sp. INWT7]QNE46065.1 molybdopterin biosynthesis protein MoeB [Glaciihabitans sp. INWT7]
MQASPGARYSRQLALPGFGPEAQQRLADARVLVIGAGGLGSSVIPALAAAGVGTIGIIDDDTVELSNLHRQLAHGLADVGRAKALSAAETVAAIDPAVTVNAVEARLTAGNALELFVDYDLVVDGSDNFPTRYLANDAAALTGIPVVWGAVSQFAGQAGVAWASKGPQYRDLFPAPPPPGSVLSCEAGGVLPTVVAVIGSIMAGEALKLLTGVGRPLIGRVTTFDALTGGFRELAYAPDPDAAPITALVDYELFCGIRDTIDVDELASSLDGVTLIDVRELWEAEIASLPGSTLLPLGSIESRLGEIDRSKPVVVYCHSGIRSASAVAMLGERDIPARSLVGGIDAWSRRIDPSVARY